MPELLPSGYHGPLVVALDSNVLIDMQVHGAVLLNGEPLPRSVTGDVGYAEELLALADLLNLWLLRDIRFMVTPRSKSDSKRGITKSFLDRRLPSVDALADSLAFQFGDWDAPVPSHGEAVAPIGDETGLPSGADRDLVLEAQAVGAHVFLTRDLLVLERTRLAGPVMALLSPRLLVGELAAVGIQLFQGGVCGGTGCPYYEWPFLAPDMGKWGGLLSIFDTD